MASRVWKGTLAGALVVAALAFIYVFPPDKNSFFPRCLLFTFTGFTCPGCGGLRALHHLLHGELAAAFRLNPLVIICIPVGAVLAGVCWFRGVSAEGLLKPCWLWILLGAGILFGIARNLPVFSPALQP